MHEYFIESSSTNGAGSARRALAWSCPTWLVGLLLGFAEQRSPLIEGIVQFLVNLCGDIVSSDCLSKVRYDERIQGYSIIRSPVGKLFVQSSWKAHADLSAVLMLDPRPGKFPAFSMVCFDCQLQSHEEFRDSFGRGLTKRGDSRKLRAECHIPPI
jgi:hypothetical protein